MDTDTSRCKAKKQTACVVIQVEFIVRFGYKCTKYAECTYMQHYLRYVVQQTPTKHDNGLPSPCSPVNPKIPATQPDAIPMKERILSIRLRLNMSALGSKTSFVDVVEAAPGVLPPSRSAIGSIMVAECFRF